MTPAQENLLKLRQLRLDMNKRLAEFKERHKRGREEDEKLAEEIQHAKERGELFVDQKEEIERLREELRVARIVGEGWQESSFNNRNSIEKLQRQLSSVTAERDAAITAKELLEVRLHEKDSDVHDELKEHNMTLEELGDVVAERDRLQEDLASVTNERDELRDKNDLSIQVREDTIATIYEEKLALATKCKRLEDALRPFAKCCHVWDSSCISAEHPIPLGGGVSLTVGQFRGAREILNQPAVSED